MKRSHHALISLASIIAVASDIPNSIVSDAARDEMVKVAFQKHPKQAKPNGRRKDLSSKRGKRRAAK